MKTHTDFRMSVASPCHADWSQMSGDERVRFCGSCQKHVYNLSAMTRREAQALVEEREGKLCVRFFRRVDGTVLTADCPVGVALKEKLTRAGRRAIKPVLAALSLGLGLFGVASRCGREQQALMGAIALPKTVAGEPPVPPPPEMGKLVVPPTGEKAGARVNRHPH